MRCHGDFRLEFSSDHSSCKNAHEEFLAFSLGRWKKEVLSSKKEEKH
jgi:hypothetical protein